MSSMTDSGSVSESSVLDEGGREVKLGDRFTGIKV